MANESAVKACDDALCSLPPESARALIETFSESISMAPAAGRTDSELVASIRRLLSTLSASERERLLLAWCRTATADRWPALRGALRALFDRPELELEAIRKAPKTTH